MDAGAVTQASLLGLLFLIFFGSLLAFAAYSSLLERYPPTLVRRTHVNPLVAVLLGWFYAGEKIPVSIVFSAALAISAIGLVNSGSAERVHGDNGITAPCGGADAPAGGLRPAGTAGALLGGGQRAGQAPGEYRGLVTHLLQLCPGLVGKKLPVASEAEQIGELGEGA